MRYFYSGSVRGFFSKEIHGEDMPEDVVGISRAEHEALMLGQNNGGIIIPDESGRPILSMPTSPPDTPPSPIDTPQSE